MTTIARSIRTGLDTTLIRNLALGGLAGLVAWEIVARGVAPAVVGGPLEPQGLIIGLARNTVGVSLNWYVASAVHVLTALLAYPALYWGMTRFGPLKPGFVGGAAMGVATWFLAFGVFMPLAGMPFMLGFGALTWMSLIGHAALGLATAYAFEALNRR